MTEISNPHDKFFKEVFTRRKVAVDFLRNYLPEEVFSCLDEESIYLRKDSFVDKDLDTYFSDLVYQASLKDGSDSFVYVLFEHKSYPEPLIAFQLLRYMIKLWEQVLKQDLPGKLPSIIPIVVYHGLARWKVSERFSGLFECPEEIKSFLPDFTYVLCDVSRFSDREIRGIVTLKTALLLLKYIQRDELRDHLPKILGLLRELIDKKTGMEYLETILTYVSRGTDRVEEEDVCHAVEEAFPVIGGNIMPTLAEKWIEQGIQQGVQQGIQQGVQQGMQQGVQQGIQQGVQQGMQQGVQQGMLQSTREAVMDILELRFGVIPESIVKRLNEIYDPSILKMLHRKAVKVDSLEGFGEIIDLIMK